MSRISRAVRCTGSEHLSAKERLPAFAGILVTMSLAGVLIGFMHVAEAADHCVVFSLDDLGQSEDMDRFMEGNPDAREVPITDVMPEATLRAFGDYNQSMFAARCVAAVEEYVTKNYHCVDRDVYAGDDPYPGRWVCQHDADENNLGYWDEEGNWVLYPSACPDNPGGASLDDTCPYANVIDKESIGVLE